MHWLVVMRRLEESAGRAVDVAAIVLGFPTGPMAPV